MLLAHGKGAPAGAVLVAVGAIGVEAIGHGVGQSGELFGAKLGALAGQISFDTFAGGLIDPSGQLVVEAADDRDVFGSELSGSLCCGGIGQYRRQRFAGEAAPLAEVGGFADAPGGLGAADQRPFGHRMGQLAAQFFWGGLARKVIDQLVLRGRQLAACPLTALQERQPLPGGQRAEIQPGHTVERGV